MHTTNRHVLTALAFILTLSVGSEAWASCESSTGDSISATGKYGKVKFKEPFREIKPGIIPEFKGRIYFRPRNGGCFVSVNPRNGDILVGTGDLKHPGCDAGKWGWWDIKWTDDGRDSHFDAMVDFLKTQYKVTLISSGKEWKLCLDN